MSKRKNKKTWFSDPDPDPDPVLRAIEDARRLGESELRLPDMGLTTLPDSIAQLTQLKTLYLQNNHLATLPDSIAQLAKLESLYLHGNHLTMLPDSIARLTQLKTLYLQNNHLATLPDSIAELKQLEMLDLGRNQFTILPDSISQLAGLANLYLSHNQLTALPDSIAQLAQLKRLYLDRNQLTTLPSTIAQLPQLKTLDLRDNKLNALPRQLTQFPCLRDLFLHGNPDLKIPDEILGPTPAEVDSRAKQPKPAREILAYVFQAALDSRPLNEAKLILVGHGEVGKTSLVKALTTGNFKKGEETTQGIKISDWNFPLTPKDSVTVHIWDFGGQEMMHATHQFFLTRRSLYLLVLNRRRGGVDREADYWFRTIRAFGGPDAQVIVVLNKQRFEPFDVNREGWLEKYPSNIKGFIATDCEDTRSIVELEDMIAAELRSMESLKAHFPQRWFAVKSELSRMKAEHITFEQYRELCQKYGEPDPTNQTMLAGFLHDLGIALNYQEDHRLSFNYVLKPEWVTKGIYSLLHAFMGSKGVFTHAEAANQLAKMKYSAEDTWFILTLMERFDLCFPLADRQNRVLIPELLDDRQPKEVVGFIPVECLNFGYEYSILPEGLLPRFIARTHHLGQPETRWKSGVVLTDDSSGCRALVRADTADAQVRVNIDGPVASRPELLGIVRYNLEVIHRDYKLEPRALVYAPGEPGKSFSLSELEELSRQKRETVEALLPSKKIINPRIVDLVTPAQSAPAQVTLFLSYAHDDEKYVEELRKRLRPMERNGTLRAWYDRKLTAGERWKDEILRELKSADIVVCQLSSDFLDSDFCVLTELNEAVTRQEAGEAVMVAYVLRVCGWKDEPRLAPFQLLPHDGKELRAWKDKDKFWQAVADGIKEATKKLQAKRKERGECSRMDV